MTTTTNEKKLFCLIDTFRQPLILQTLSAASPVSLDPNISPLTWQELAQKLAQFP